MFSKCAESLEDGKRLENLSWRIWNRETLCCDSLPEARRTTALAIRPRPKKEDVPDLSASVDSFASEDSAESETQEQSLPQPQTAPLDIQPVPVRQDLPTLAVSRGKEKHITPLRLEKMVESIQEKQKIAPLSPTIVDAVPDLLPSTTDITPRPESPSVHAPLRSSDSSSSTAPLSSPESDRSTAQTVGSDTSAELLTSHSIVRGFSPNQTSSSYRNHTHLAPAPVPGKSISHMKHEEPKRTIFTLGGSSGEDESSFEDHMPSHSKQSSLTAGLRRPAGSKKQTSFREELESRLVNNRSHEDEEVFASDDEDSSAIEDDSEDDDDEEDWEDDGSDGAENGPNDKPLFQRVDSKPNLVSRRSLLTSLMHEGDRQNAFASMAQSQAPLRKSKTQVQLDPSIRFSEADNDGLSSNGPHMKRSKPILMTPSSSQPMPIAFSPRTTRRQMLANEMTESLRKAVLFERQQKKATANAILRRRHTTQDLTNIKDYPSTEGEEGTKDNHSWNDDYLSGGTHDYNQSGW